MMSADPSTSVMRRAISLAFRGRGGVEPNPLVGCVLTRPDGRVIGEGYHARVGGPHAEPEAMTGVIHPADLRGAIAYVTLEPCCHERKRTPPCVPALIRAGVAKVIVGAIDPNPAVNGRGVAMLRTSGVEVSPASSDEGACRQLLAPFYATTVLRRPYVTLKWAETSDGYVAGPLGQPRRVSGPEATAWVHGARSRVDAILVGSGTVRSDDPLLTARPPHAADAGRRPIRAILSTRGLIPPAARLLSTVADVPTVVYVAATKTDSDVIRLITASGADVVTCGMARSWRRGSGHDTVDFTSVLTDLCGRGVTHLLIEPGPTLACSLLSRGDVDRSWVIRSPSRPGVGLPGPCLPQGWLRTLDRPLGRDVLTEYLNPRSRAYFACEPSPDVVSH